MRSAKTGWPEYEVDRSLHHGPTMNWFEELKERVPVP